MSCPYSYYDENEQYMPRLYCKVNGKGCMYSKKCLKENRFIPLDNQGECYIMIQERQKNIPKGSYFVQTTRPNKNGKLYLYVVVDDAVVRVPSEFTELNQHYIYLKETLDGYEVSLTPFVEEKKKTTSRAKK